MWPVNGMPTFAYFLKVNWDRFANAKKVYSLSLLKHDQVDSLSLLRAEKSVAKFLVPDRGIYSTTLC